MRDIEFIWNAVGENTPPESNGDVDCSRFIIKNVDKKLLLAAISANDRTLWMRKLEETRKDCLLTERAALQRQISSKSASVFVYWLACWLPTQILNNSYFDTFDALVLF